ncbi:MAG: AzlD domain-containing protein [Sphaerochaetaceae bacterium]|nr:AzlD domain-containing protein [Sphaerochaetaceae bacterium]
MDSHNIYVYLAIISMAAATNLVRVLPSLLLKKPIKNTFIKSFLYYAPYVTLSVMAFPSILYSTGNFTASLIGFIFVAALCFTKAGMFVSTIGACIVVYLAQLVF